MYREADLEMNSYCEKQRKGIMGDKSGRVRPTELNTENLGDALGGESKVPQGQTELV